MHIQSVEPWKGNKTYATDKSFVVGNGHQGLILDFLSSRGGGGGRCAMAVIVYQTENGYCWGYPLLLLVSLLGGGGCALLILDILDSRLSCLRNGGSFLWVHYAAHALHFNTHTHTHSLSLSPTHSLHSCR